MDDAQVSSVLHSQNIARRVGAAQLGVEVYGWALRNAKHIPADEMKALLDIVSKEPE